MTHSLIISSLRSSSRLARDSSSAGKPAANEKFGSTVMSTDFPTADTISQTDAEAQRKLLREYEQKVAELLEQQKLTKLCSHAGFSKNTDKGQFFITLDEEGPDDVKTSCREYIVPRNEETSLVRGWIRGNTKISPLLDVKVCHHQGRYGAEIMIQNFSRPNSFLGSHRERNQQTETSEEFPIASVENGGTGKPVAKAKPRPKPTFTLTPVSIPYHERKG